MDFVNSEGDSAALARFVRRWGPLSFGWRDREERLPNVDFTESLEEWQEAQAEFRQLWESRIRMAEITGLKDIGDLAVVGWRLSDQDSFYPNLRGRGAAIVFGNLRVALHVLFELQPLPLRKMCANPDCNMTPFFIAATPRQRYCCDSCAAYGQREAKRAWWETSGNDWRAKRRGKQRKGKTPGGVR